VITCALNCTCASRSSLAVAYFNIPLLLILSKNKTKKNQQQTGQDFKVGS